MGSLELFLKIRESLLEDERVAGVGVDSFKNIFHLLGFLYKRLIK